MDKEAVEQLILDCLSEVSQDIVAHDSLEFLFHNIKPAFIVEQLARKLVEKENELAHLLF